MKKTILLSIIMLLMSCSKKEESFIKYKLQGVSKTSTEKITYSEKYNTIIVQNKNNQYGTIGEYLVFQLSIDRKSMITLIQFIDDSNSNKNTIKFIEKLEGSHTINNNIINGRYNSKTSSDFIEFKNYHL